METLFARMIADRWTGAQYTESLGNAFEEWKEKKLIKDFAEECMNRHTIVENELKTIPTPFVNASQNKPYRCEMILPESITGCSFVGVEEIGLCATMQDHSVIIEGTPTSHGEKDIVLQCTYEGWVDGMPRAKRVFHLSVNPDPWELWKDMPTDPNLPYAKPDADSLCLRMENGLRMIAASRRGRSHAQDGRPRDDDFRLYYDSPSGWCVMAVADGAGSAAFSREGSRLACDEAVEFCKISLADRAAELDAALTAWQSASTAIQQPPLTADGTRSMDALPVQDKITGCFPKNESETASLSGADFAASQEEEGTFTQAESSVTEASKDNVPEKAASGTAEALKIKTAAFHAAYKMLVNAAYEARKSIESVVLAQPYGQGDSKHFATTLLLAMCKKYDFGWAVLTFSIGDGAIGIVCGDKAELLCKPDEGEFSGQTRFLTMRGMFSDSSELMRRVKVKFYDDFDAVFLMTDGVSDPWFETSAALHSTESWMHFLSEIAPLLSEPDDNAAQRLLDWLNFRIPGNHDDRTIAILH
ncbi:MAG: protein phosphatase 2C domain-containing protein [Mailhella sp.]|nr:protein phosphatase 2C domain-containing protein [Mailhella sp.]